MVQVAFLGPRGTYSHEAAVRAAPENASLVPVSTLADVVNSVAEGRTDIGVLPVENSTNGAVAGAWDALLAIGIKTLRVIGEVRVPIRHQLYSRTADLEDIRVIYSHPQVWGQTQQWRSTYLPNAKCVDAPSTAEAVKIALATEHSAAIGGPGSGKELGVAPIKNNVADNQDNETRFLVLSRKGDSVVELVTTSSLTELGSLLGETGAYFVTSRPLPEPWQFTYIVERRSEQGSLSRL